MVVGMKKEMCSAGVLVLVLSYIGAAVVAGEQLSIAAFNIQIFGRSKFSDSNGSVVDILSRIVRRYDIILIQEIRDSSETVIHSFLDRVNSDAVTDGVEYALTVSERLGRTRSKEQYAFLYRVDKLQVLQTHQFNDSLKQFERPPYSVLLRSTTLSLPEFFLMGIHIKPSAAFKEINALLPAFEKVSSTFGTTRGLILGDMNADCSWLSQKRYDKLALVNDPDFQWLINEDTTTNSNDCSYDRIVAYETLSGYLVNGSAGVLRFDTEYSLSKKDALEVSDHYPVHVSLQVVAEEQLSVAAFNIHIFGRSKFKNATVVDILSRIVRRYDIILIQEIRDSSEEVIHLFLDRVNSDAVTDGVVYALNVSKRLGRTRNKQQYAFLYRVNKLQVLQTHQFMDSLDQFERPPYSVLLRSTTLSLPEFFLMGIKTRPSSTFEEINALLPVFEKVSSTFGTTRGLILGDMSADCSWLSQKRYDKLALVNGTDFQWLINEDTTTNSNDCSYDRIVASETLSGYLVNGSAGVFRFDSEYSLSKKDALKVSDHYPVHVSLQVVAEEQLSVAAFNIHIFGPSKLGDTHVVDILSRIVRRYDIVLIQEIRDSSEEVIHSFLNRVNSDAVTDGVEYALTVSKRLGRTRNKQQYAFLYRVNKLQVLQTHQFTDSLDQFERPPYSVLLRSTTLSLPEFFLMGINTRPSSAFKEINALLPAFEKVSSTFGTTRGLILGDMSADCSWLSQKRYDKLALVNGTDFQWLINEDTTTSNNDCSYDRIVASETLSGYLVNGSAGVFRFDTEYSLSKQKALKVSYHYPVHVILQDLSRG